MAISGYKSIIDKRVHEARVARTHPAKLMILQRLLKELFGIELIELLPGIEKRLGSKIYGFRGRTDLLFRSVIFEIKTNLGRELDNEIAFILFKSIAPQQHFYLRAKTDI